MAPFSSLRFSPYSGLGSCFYISVQCKTVAFFSAFPLQSAEFAFHPLYSSYQLQGSGAICCCIFLYIPVASVVCGFAAAECVALCAGLKDRERAAVQESWMDGDVPVITATVSFGMGVDKATVRLASPSRQRQAARRLPLSAASAVTYLGWPPVLDSVTCNGLTFIDATVVCCLFCTARFVEGCNMLSALSGLWASVACCLRCQVCGPLEYAAVSGRLLPRVGPSWAGRSPRLLPNLLLQTGRRRKR